MMKGFNNKSIRIKLICSFSTVLTLLIVITILSLAGGGTASKLYQKAYEEYALKAEYAAMASSHVYEATAEIELVMIVSDSKDALSRAELAKENIGIAVEYMDKVADGLNDPEITKLYQEARTQMDTYKDSCDALLVPLFGGNLAGTLELMSKVDINTIRTLVDQTLGELNDGLLEAGDTQMKAAEKRWNLNANGIVAIALITVVVSEFVIIVTVRNIRIPLRNMTDAADKIALGEIDVEIKKYYNDEIGQLADSMKKMVENIKNQTKVTQEIAAGNLLVEVVPASDADVLSLALKKVVDDNNEALGSMKEATMQVSSGAEQVASASQSLAQGSTEQASAIQQITASIDEIATRTKVNANDANEANQLVNGAKDGALRGNERMSEMIQAMFEINESSENISKIMKVIDDIAFQTNILALNAAVEAARAGQHGKGFAVVAEEVRNLAGKSAQAASETAEMIEDSIKRVAKGSKLAQDTADALNDIVKAIDQIVTLTGSIATASNDQATAVTQIDQAISQVSIVVQNNSSTSEECAAASEELSAQALKLQEMISTYRLRENTYNHKQYSQPEQKKTETAGFIETANAPMISLDDGFGKY